MRRRRKSRTPANELRNLALAGRWAELRALLTERLARNPQDEEARSELERLNQGLPLRATESALARKRREEQEMLEELAGELSLYRSNPALIESWEPGLLARRRKRVALALSRIGKRLPAELGDEARSYLARLTTRLRKQQGKRRSMLMLGLGLPLTALFLAGTFLVLHHRAVKVEAPLRVALQANNLDQAERALRMADSGINRLVSPALSELIDEVQAWQARTERLEAELQKEIARLELEERPVRTLPLVRRAAIEEGLASLPTDMPELRERWQRLCDKEARALAAQREEVARNFNAPLPPLPTLSEQPVEDDKLLQQQQQQLQNLEKEWTAAHSIFHLDQAYGEALKERLDQLSQLRADIAALRRALSLLPSTRSYAQYRKMLEQHKPRLYKPALRMATTLEQLPAEDKLRDLMQGHGGQLPPGMLEAARRAHLHGGPSFPPAFPASARQVQLMEDIFTYTGFQKELYQLSAHTLPSFIVEEKPTVSETSVSFRPSPLSPGYSLTTPQRITWHNPQGVFIRRIDATPLLRQTGINRESFFNKANLPTLLDTLLRPMDSECPALARAYVFKRLLELMDKHTWPMMLGLTYAPTLRADARSFASLTRSLGITLEPGCWLPATPAVARAEEACARWFHERRHRSYAKEIERNFGALVQVHPRYIGYINEAGKPQLFKSLPAGTLLWYLGKDGLTATPQEEALESPLIYSPVFVVARN